ncbi:MAG: hypothetical protein KGL53_04535, partial [Elusimicrobia bacterium]|nr:hypothetical protein [Elusimicrobiota bacterium]
GDAAEAGRLRARADAIESGSARARAALDANAAGLQELLKKGGPGWELEARKLLMERSQLVDKAVAKENPIYETFRRMREDVYGLVDSRLRVKQTAELLAEAPNRAGKTAGDAADAIVSDAAKAAEDLRARAAGSPDGAALRAKADALLAEAEGQARALRQAGEDARARMEKPLNAEHAASLEARRQAQAGLERAEKALYELRDQERAAGEKATPELKARLEAAQEEFARRLDVYKQTNKRVAGFETARLESARQAVEALKARAEAASQALGARLDGVSGPAADALRRELTGTARSFDSQARRLEWTPERAVDVLQRRIAGVSYPEYLARTAMRWSGLQWVLSKLPGVSESRWARPMTPADVGLTRIYARELIGEFIRDPFLPPQVRWKMLWSLGSSTVMPRGLFGNGSSWVLTELLNLATGYTDNPANIRMDNLTGRVNVIHNGQWFDSMDTPTRRYWELEYGSDLTLPYDHKTQVTMNDFVRDNKNVRFVGFSGTAGDKFREYLEKYDVRVGGVGSEGVKDVALDLTESPAGKYTAVGDAVRDALSHDAAQLASGKQADALVVVSLPDTRMVKEVRRYLLKTKTLTPDQIAMVFSDAELLRLNRPEADVERQMNLGGLNDGKVKLLLLDTRVGGRGLDLNFKGRRGGGGFGGYFDFNMLVVDPQLASEAHYLQAQGRIDTGRIYSSPDPNRAYHPEAATRRFSLVMDVQSAEKDPVFMRMVRDEPVFQQLRDNARVREIAQAHGRFAPDWEDVQEYVLEAEAEGKSGFVTRRYEETVRRYLKEKQMRVELDQLRSAGVLPEAGSFDPRLYGLAPVVPGSPYPGAQ